VIVPMFHVNAWGTVFYVILRGRRIDHAQMYLQGAPIIKMVRELRPTISLGVPTVWNDVLRVAESTPETDFSSLRRNSGGWCRGAPFHDRDLSRRIRHRRDPRLGHDRDQPLAAVSNPPAGTPRNSRSSTE